MSRITLNIAHLVLKGFEPGDRNALVQGLQAELSRVLADQGTRAQWALPHRTPVLRLGRIAFEPDPAGGRKFGGALARAIGKGLKP